MLTLEGLHFRVLTTLAGQLILKDIKKQTCSHRHSNLSGAWPGHRDVAKVLG